MRTGECKVIDVTLKYGYDFPDSFQKHLPDFDQTYEIPEGPGFFKYMIADDYVPSREYPEKFTTEVIPENTWAVFPCKGTMPESLQSVNQKIFREWLPQNPDYEIAGKQNIEMYTDASKYPKGTTDENYYSEIWIPVKAKQN